MGGGGIYVYKQDALYTYVWSLYIFTTKGIYRLYSFMNYINSVSKTSDLLIPIYIVMFVYNIL